MSQLLLVRHCESSGQVPDAPLTEEGFLQASRLAEFLAPLEPDHVVSSPFLRAQQTIEPLATSLGLRVATEARLAERRLSGEPLDDWREQLRRSWQDLDHRPPGGETSREAQRRGREAFDEIAARGHRCAVLVSHGNLLGLVMKTIDPSFGYDHWQALTNPDVFRVRFFDGADPAIERLWLEPRDG